MFRVPWSLVPAVWGLPGTPVQALSKKRPEQLPHQCLGGQPAPAPDRSSSCPSVLATHSTHREVVASGSAWRCCQPLHTGWHPGGADQHVWATGPPPTPTPCQRTSCLWLHTCHRCSSVPLWAGEGSSAPATRAEFYLSMIHSISPTPSHSVEITQCLKSSSFTSLFVRLVVHPYRPLQIFPCGRHSCFS